MKVKGPRNLGANNFFYFNEDKVKKKHTKEYVYPAITSSRYVPFFTFTDDDWKKLRDRGANCYFFICHKPRDSLPKHILEYIKWGETECKTMIRRTRGGGKTCSLALACQEREKYPEYFYGWYDLGGVERSPIIAIRNSQYKIRFILNEKEAATYDNIICFIPKENLTQLHIKGLLAYLNSSFVHLYVESEGVISGGGIIQLNVQDAQEMPILDVRKLDIESLRELATLFENLDRESRKLGGADTKENIERLWDTIIAEIDKKVTEILRLPEYLPDAARTLAKMMMERRLARTKQPRPTAIRGTSETPQIKQLSKERQRKKKKTSRQTSKLDNFIK